MTPDRFEAIRVNLGWSTRYIASRLRTNRYVVAQWALGNEAMPDNVVKWLENAVSGIEAMPLPIGWSIRDD